MATGKEGLYRSIGVFASGIVTGGLAYLIQECEPARDFVMRLTQLKKESTLDTLTGLMGLYAVIAVPASLITLPYYTMKSIFGETRTTPTPPTPHPAGAAHAPPAPAHPPAAGAHGGAAHP